MSQISVVSVLRHVDQLLYQEYLNMYTDWGTNNPDLHQIIFLLGRNGWKGLCSNVKLDLWLDIWFDLLNIIFYFCFYPLFI